MHNDEPPSETRDLDMKSVCRVRLVPGPDLPIHIGTLLVDVAAERYLIRKIAQAWSPLCSAFFGHSNDLESIITSFFHDFLPAHHRLNFPERGSTTLGGLLALYVIVRELRPSVIVESGTFVGSSLHALRQASQEGDLWSFDVSYESLRYRHSSIHYVEHDWSRSREVTARSDRDFCFFDDHIDNAMRIAEARARGFRFLLFDDAPEIGQISRYRYPGVPTVPMILDRGLETISVCWKYQNELWLRYDHDPTKCRSARSMIDLAEAVPDLRAAVGLQVGDKWLVRLR